MRCSSSSFLVALVVALMSHSVAAFSLSMIDTPPRVSSSLSSSRRTFLTNTVTAAVIATTASSVMAGGPASAASPEIFTTDAGVKYAILKQPKDPKKAVSPQPGDIVAVEYTGYLTNGVIFDATHAEGKSNAILFKLGTTVVNPGLNDMVSQMVVGQKVQAIIPPALAFGDKGICLEDGECLVKPGSTLVYDIYLKKSSIPPP